MYKKYLILCVLMLWCIGGLRGQSLAQLQQDFIDLRFGMFIHFNMPTYANADWPDPDAPASLFNPVRMDCRQWAKAAKSAHMRYGCLTTKHHSGFCIWDTKTTSYNVMSSPFKRDVVKEYTEAFRAEGLKVMLYYSILDTHHFLRPGWINSNHLDMVKQQLRELLTNYGEITALIIDGWDAPWSRISYDDISFEEVYRLVKSIQPNCLVMDLNAAKYPAEGLFYTDIKSYEQGAGQHIKKEENHLPALSCLPLNDSWFWKDSFPTSPVKDARMLVDKNIVPMGKAHCNFILNVAPNRDGLIDSNALEALEEIGRLWKEQGPAARLDRTDIPVISSNLAKRRPADGSWSYDTGIMDFATDDDFTTSWVSHPSIKNPWLAVFLDKEQPINMVVITEKEVPHISGYTFEYRVNGVWKFLCKGGKEGRVKIHRFNTVYADAVRLNISTYSGEVAVAELGVYCERR